jgi:hypothetical protein
MTDTSTSTPEQAKQLSTPQLVLGLTYNAALQGVFAFYFLRDLSLHSYGWAMAELVLLGIWTWILKGKLDRWRTPG